MAVRYAVATGNWSATATWNGGTLPTSADDVYANNFTVTIDQNVTVLSLRTTSNASPVVAAGGGFTLTAGFTATCTGTGIVPGSSSAVTYSGSGTATLAAAVASSTTTTNVNAVSMSGTGTLNINGNVRGTTLNNGGAGLYMSAGTVNVTGDVTAGGGNNSHGITMAGGVLSITGTITGGVSTGGPSYGVNSTAGTQITVVGSITTTGTFGGNYGISMTGAATSLSVTGNVTPGTTQSNIHAIYNTGNSTTKTLSVVGTVTATSAPSGIGSHGIYDTNNAGGWTIVGGSLIDSSQGDSAVNARRFRCIPTLSTRRVHANNTGYPNGGTITYASLDYLPANVPTPANVRSGTVYGDAGSFTGTCAVPAAASVAYGVPVDNTTGTAALSPADVAALVGAQIAAALNSTP